MTRMTILFAFVGFCTPLVLGDVVVTPIVSSVSGGNLLSYTLSNNGGTDVIGFALYTNTNDLTLGSPSGWASDIFSIGNQFQIQWASDGSNDLLPGMGLAGFSVLTKETLGKIQYSYLDSDFNQLQGETLGPIASTGVPEPSCLALLGIITVLAGTCFIKRCLPRA